MRVLAKSEIEGNIIMPEFLQIMENLGLYEYEDEHLDEEEAAAAEGEPSKRGKNQLDLSKLDQKSVKIMVMLMLYLLNQDMTT